MKIVFMGTPTFAIPSLEALVSNGHEIQAVFTQTDKPKGRGNKIAFSPVKEYAIAHNIPVYQPNSLKKETEVYLPILKDLNPDMIVVAAYGKILPAEILELPKYGCINVHGSLLPKYRGAAPIQWTVLNGDEFGGITTMQMAEGLDTGDMLMSEKVAVKENETASELYDRLSYVGSSLLIKTIKGLVAGEITPVKQNESESSYAPMLTKDMCAIDFSLPATEVHHKILGLSDSPGACCYLDGKRLKVYRSELVSIDSSYPEPGVIIDEHDFTVSCGTGSVRFTEIQAEGSKRMNVSDYLRGRPVRKGTKLESNPS
ncbi:MAG: methionyl-tRNA formyltransferase [Oscillospiraceae bacterium]|nr:methionyl-tRNA formyltransferase [Oscillospiraceae bacterium]